ncbi:M50 family metallopeptidase [Motilimonas pumila]|uniref:M50 family peptidase n=1 Tax=Motilimonas pumila TaxID=2303987 RepID=A0A418YG04_9GAMM|nr:M50 family metallopeptidase [Motilimonas pumila]RJG48475.1 M50 family peptidase [Motilimonas pumila]
MYRQKSWLSLLLVIILYLAWHTPWVLPLKILVVFFHEFSHALLTWLTGGSVKSFVVSSDQSGHVISAGGHRFSILTAGYLGSILIGAGIYRFAHQPLLLPLMGAIMLLVGGFFFGSTFTLIFSALSAAVLILCYLKLSSQWQAVILQTIGLASLLYVPYDVFQDTVMYSHHRSDAAMLADEFFGTTWMWGGIWTALCCVIFYLTVIKPLFKREARK